MPVTRSYLLLICALSASLDQLVVCCVWNVDVAGCPLVDKSCNINIHNMVKHGCFSHLLFTFSFFIQLISADNCRQPIGQTPALITTNMFQHPFYIIQIIH